MELFQNKKVIILSIIIVILLVAIGGTIYGIYSSNKQQTSSKPIDEESQKLGDKNIVENNNTVDITRKYD